MSEQAKRPTGIFVISGTTMYQELISTNFPQVSAELLDTTSQNNAQGFTTKMIGWLTSGDVKFTVNFYGNTEQVAAYTTAIAARTKSTWIIGIPNLIAVKFTAQLSGANILAPMKGAAMTMEIGLTVNDVPTVLSSQATGLTTPWITMTNEGSTSIALSPTAAASQWGTTYYGTALKADTGVKITPTASSGTIYVNGTLVVSGAATDAITLPTTDGDVLYIPVIVFGTAAQIPATYWVRVLNGYV